MLIKISNDFSDTPGARYYKDGDHSGEEFYEKILRHKFEECRKINDSLIIDFDDCYGFASSFLSESFGRLSEEFGASTVLKFLKFISKQDPLIPEEVKRIINSPRRQNDES